MGAAPTIGRNNEGMFGHQEEGLHRSSNQKALSIGSEGDDEGERGQASRKA